METVSYLTINDKTKEIADIASRNNIENIALTVETHSANIEDIQYETSPQGPLATSINEAYSIGYVAQANAAVASEAASIANNNAILAGQAASVAQQQADNATESASVARNKAIEASNAADTANEKADSANRAAVIAWDNTTSATQAAAQAWTKAVDAENAAQVANANAISAQSAATSAQQSATQANSFANGALAGLSTLESVIDTVEWFRDHRALTTDTQVNSQKTYYLYDNFTGTMSSINPVGDENPSEQGWYELDETIQNYVISHVAQTNDGLIVSSTSTGWRILVSDGSGSYFPGIFIVNREGVIKQAVTPQGISFDESLPFKIGDENAYLIFTGSQNNNSDENNKIIIGGNNVEINASVSIGGSNKTLSEVLNDLGNAITSIEYGLGNSFADHSDITNWSTDTPEWEPDKYMWMRTSTNGLEYTYTCIQGARGPQGETGATGENGEPGTDGIDGFFIVSSEITYAISDAPDEIPGEDEWVEDFSELMPIPQGKWLWTCTVVTYSDDTIGASYQTSYVGTDGQDGTSVFIQNVSKDNGITTVTLVDDTGIPQTLQIADGEDGSNGIPGATGYIHIAWADNIEINQDTSISATGFSINDSTDKLYMGVYTDTTETDSNNPSDYSWTLIKGADGTSVTITDIKYAVNSDGTSQPANSDFSTTYPSVNKGQWLWVKTTYSDGKVAVTKSYIGTDGEDGQSITIGSINKANGVTTITLVDENGSRNINIEDGKDGEQGVTGQPGADGKPSYTHFAWASNVTIDNSTTPQTVRVTGFTKNNTNADKPYLGVYTDEYIQDSNEPTDYSWTLIKGPQGADGKILNILSGIYTSSELPPFNTVQDADAYLVDDGDGQYDLYYKGTDASDWTIVENWQGVKGDTGEQGPQGERGPQGYSISQIINYYLATSQSSGVTTSTTGWNTDASTQMMTATNKYLWNYEVTKNSNNQTINATTPTIIGVYGEDGTPGTDGKGITSITEYYARNNSSIAPIDDDFSPTVIAPNAENKYLWNYEIITYTTGNPTKTDKHIIGVYGDKGEKGDTGDTPVITTVKNGKITTIKADGTSIGTIIDGSDGQSPTVSKSGKVVTIIDASGSEVTISDGEDGESIKGDDGDDAYFHIAWANSSDGATDFSTTSAINKLYMGTYTDHIQTDSQTPSKYKWVKVKGEQGVSVTNVSSTNSTASGGTSVVTVTLSDGSSKTFNVKNGIDGQTPNVTTEQISNGYEILVNGSVVATVNDGSDGHSPVVTTNSITDGYQILVDGVVIATVMDGAPGLNSATVYLYKRAASASKPTSGSWTYTFSTGKLSTVPSGWSQTFPAETQGNTTPVWMMYATASALATETTDTISYNEWTEPVKMVSSGSNGTNGIDGYNTATIYLYQKKSTVPSKPSNSLTYTFSSHSITAGTINNGWLTSIPSTGEDPIWVIAATVVGKDATQTIASNNWSDPVKLAENGTSVTVTSNVTEYTSSTSGTTTPDSGWQNNIPQVAQGDYLWTKVTTTFSDSNSAVSYTVSRQGTNGTNGTSVTVSSTEYSYQLSTNGTTPPTGEWKSTPQAPTTTQYAWTKTVVTYSDNSKATTYTVGGKSGINGTNSYTYIRYGTNSSGAGMSTTPTASTTYIGLYVGDSPTAPTTANSYTWSKYVGEKGDTGEPGIQGATGPEATVTIVPNNINWDNNTATLNTIVRVNGIVQTPPNPNTWNYVWTKTKGLSTTSLTSGTGSNYSSFTLDGTTNALDSTYNCTVTW